MMIVIIITVLDAPPPHVSRYGFTLPDNDDYPDTGSDDDDYNHE